MGLLGRSACYPQRVDTVVRRTSHRRPTACCRSEPVRQAFGEPVVVEVPRHGKSLAFVRGVLEQDGRKLLSYSATIKLRVRS